MANDDYPTAQPFLPDSLEYSDLVEAAEGCRGCPLYNDATNLVFGEGPINAEIMLVGEAPGRAEDSSGRPFVGSSGQLLDEALEEAGLTREQIYITNAVKHIRWSSKNGERTPEAPNASQIHACRPWLDSEIQLVEPARIVAVGTRAARSLLDNEVTISQARGVLHRSRWHVDVVVTYHPAAALRHPVSSERDQIYDSLVEDLYFAQQFPEPPDRPRPRA